MRPVEQIFFRALYAAQATSVPRRGLAVAAMLLRCLQRLVFTLSAASPFSGPASAWLVYVCEGTAVAPLLSHLGYPGAFVAVSIAACAVGCAAAVVLVGAMWAIERGPAAAAAVDRRHLTWPRVLHVAGTLMSGVLHIPMIAVYLGVLSCAQSDSIIASAGIGCWSNGHLALAIVSLVALLFHSIFVALATNSVERSVHAKDLMARPHGYGNLIGVMLDGFLVVIVLTLPSELGTSSLLVGVLLAESARAMSIVVLLPYYDVRATKLELSCACVQVWGAVCSIVWYTMAQPSDPNAGILFVLALPLCFGVAAFIVDVRLGELRRAPAALLTSVYSVEAKARLVIADALTRCGNTGAVDAADRRAALGVFEDSLPRFGQNTLFRLCLADFYWVWEGNRFLMMKNAAFAGRAVARVDERYWAFAIRQRVLDAETATATGIAIGLKQDFDQRYRDALDSALAVAAATRRVWSEMKAGVVDVDAVQAAATDAGRAMRLTRAHFEAALQKQPAATHVMRAYAGFLDGIFDAPAAANMRSLADTLEERDARVGGGGRGGGAPREERFRFLAETTLNVAADRCGMLEVHLDPHNIGHVKSANGDACELFGYTAAELGRMNVSELMPEPVCTLHDELMRRYVDRGACTMVGSTKQVLGLHEDGTVFPMVIQVMGGPDASSLLAFMRRVHVNNEEYVLLGGADGADMCGISRALLAAFGMRAGDDYTRLQMPSLVADWARVLGVLRDEPGALATMETLATRQRLLVRMQMSSVVGHSMHLLTVVTGGPGAAGPATLSQAAAAIAPPGSGALAPRTSVVMAIQEPAGPVAAAAAAGRRKKSRGGRSAVGPGDDGDGSGPGAGVVEEADLNRLRAAMDSDRQPMIGVLRRLRRGSLVAVVALGACLVLVQQLAESSHSSVRDELAMIRTGLTLNVAVARCGIYTQLLEQYSLGALSGQMPEIDDAGPGAVLGLSFGDWLRGVLGTNAALVGSAGASVLAASGSANVVVTMQSPYVNPTSYVTTLTRALVDIVSAAQIVSKLAVLRGNNSNVALLLANAVPGSGLTAAVAAAAAGVAANNGGGSSSGASVVIALLCGASCIGLCLIAARAVAKIRQYKLGAIFALPLSVKTLRALEEAESARVAEYERNIEVLLGGDVTYADAAGPDAGIAAAEGLAPGGDLFMVETLETPWLSTTGLGDRGTVVGPGGPDCAAGAPAGFVNWESATIVERVNFRVKESVQAHAVTLVKFIAPIVAIAALFFAFAALAPTSLARTSGLAGAASMSTGFAAAAEGVVAVAGSAATAASDAQLDAATGELRTLAARFETLKARLVFGDWGDASLDDIHFGNVCTLACYDAEDVAGCGAALEGAYAAGLLSAVDTMLAAAASVVSLARAYPPGAARDAAIANASFAELHDTEYTFLSDAAQQYFERRVAIAEGPIDAFSGLWQPIVGVAVAALMLTEMLYYLPFIRQMDKDIRAARQLLLLLPPTLARRIPRVVAYMRWAAGSGREVKDDAATAATSSAGRTSVAAAAAQEYALVRTPGSVA